MTNLTDVLPNYLITSARTNLINEYIEHGTHKINTLSVDIGGTEVITSARAGVFSGVSIGSLSGLLKADSGVVSAAILGTDYIKDLNNFSTTDLDEGINLYYTNIRAINALAPHTSDATIHFTQSNISITESQINNLKNYYLASNPNGFISNLSNFTTDNLTQGSINFYDKIVGFTGGTNVTISGTYPNFVITDNSINTSDLSTALGDYVPYSGSTSNVNLGVYNFSTTGDINADSFITNSGTSSDFVKGDGSLDSNTYLTNETDPVFSSSQASNITSTDITNLGNLSGINSGDQTSSDFDIKDLTDSTNLKTTWNNKQNELISGTNIKTINSESLLGSGNIDISGGTENSFETVSKNLKSYPYVLNYNSGELSSIVYTIGGDSITKTFNYSSGVLNSIVLSGDTPSGIDLTKTLNYSSGVLIGVSYS
jgi:hypothetical protein